MMLSIEKLMVRFAFLLILAASGSAWAELQVDLRSGMAFGVKDSNFSPVKPNPAIPVIGSLYGSFKILPLISLIAQDNIDLLFALAGDTAYPYVHNPRTLNSPYAERRYPGSNDGYLGLRLYLNGWFNLGLRNILYYNMVPMKQYSLLKDYFGYVDTLTSTKYYYQQKMRNSLIGDYLFANDYLTISLSTNYFLNQGTIIRSTDNSNYTADSIISTKADLDCWMFNTALIGGKIPKVGTIIAVDARILNHIGKPAKFNIYDFGLSLGGNADLFDNKLAYKARSSIYHQDFLTGDSSNALDYGKRSDITTGFFQTFYLRDSYSIVDGMMLKGLAVLTVAHKVVKQRYELAVRTIQRESESWVDIGGFSTMGGLFPMGGIYMRTMIHPVERLGVGLTAKSEWQWPSDTIDIDRATNFLKAGCTGEISFRITEPVEIYSSGDYMYYNSQVASDFPPRFSIALGTRILIR